MRVSTLSKVICQHNRNNSRFKT